MPSLPLSRDYIYTTNNKPKVLCLIKELCQQKDDPIFTIRDEKVGLLSLRTLFVQHTIDDPSEATFAEEVFGDVGYWLKARENKHLAPFVDEWRQEATVKRKAVAFKAMTNEVREGGRSAFTAAKFLIDEPWKDKRNPKVKKESKKTTSQASVQVQDDMERLREEGLLN